MSDSEGIGTKRTYSKVAASPEQSSKDERRELLSNEMAKPFDEFTLVDTQWLSQFYDGEDAPVLLGKGEAASKISNDAFELLSKWYGVRPDAVSVRVVNLERNRPAEVLVLETAKSLSDALEVSSTHWFYGARVLSAFADRGSLDSSVHPFEPTLKVGDLELERDESLVIENPESRPLGRTGLDNMWNTCFMNSSLQCLMHIPELLTYFVNDEFRKDLNRDNPIGCGGEVAEAFAELVQQSYNERSSSFRPVQFRATIGKFNRSFAGRMQQDSQEFTAFLLDSLHEDLNRVHQKPATMEPELGDDEEPTEAVIKRLAHESWETHKKRNDSKIMELFTGMYKSTLICPVCNKVSIRFDPFFDLTLPLPSSTYWVHSVTFLPWDTERPPARFDVALTPADPVLALKEQAAQIMNSDANRIIAGDVFQRKFYRLLKDIGSVADTIETSDVIVLYEGPPEESSEDGQDSIEAESQAMNVPVYVLSHAYEGYPFFVSVAPSTSSEAIKEQISKRLEQIVGTQPAYRTKVFDGGIDELAYAVDARRTWVLDDPSSGPDDQALSGPQTPPQETEEPFESVQAPRPSEERGEQLHSPVQSPGSSSISPISDTDSPPPAMTSEPDFFVEGETARTERHIDPRNCVLLVEVESDSDFQDVPSAFEAVDNPAATNARSIQEEHRTTTLEGCLERFSQPEILGQNDLWYCPRCKDFRQAQKQIELWRVPDVFMIHLKRFAGSMASSKKIDDLVTFPLKDLDVSKYLSDGAQKDNNGLVYDLIAVDNHYGGMGGGHYTAYVWDAFTEKWLNFNDSFVSEADPASVVSPAAYLLFYKRRSPGTSTIQSVREAVYALRSRVRKEDSTTGPTIEGVKLSGSAENLAHASLPSSPESTKSSDMFSGVGHRLGGGESDSEANPALPWS